MIQSSETANTDNLGLNWTLINDSVMGGLSTSQITRIEDNKYIRFSGFISLSKNAGFAIANTAVTPNYFSDCNRLSIKVRGDGRNYQFRLRRDNKQQDVAFVVEFETKDNIWQTKTFELSDFVAQRRGHRLKHIKPIQAGEIKTLGFLSGNEVEGEFKLDIGSISGC
jgi:hypothetical protein